MFCVSLPTAIASCPIGVPPPSFYVGSDNRCSYNRIQDAITAVSTSATCAPIIYVTDEHKPWKEALTITNRTFTLVGTTASCSTGGATGAHVESDLATPTSPQATISGAGLNAPVITISGTSNVTLQGLEITDGNIGASSEGGGIFFNGAGSLTLSGTTVDNNQADYGGGIDVSPSGKATLTLQANTLVINNLAGTSGGGIRIEGQTHLYMLADNSSVSFNDVQFDYGGGIEVLGPAVADIASSGSFGVGAISNNSAPYGGGIALLATSNGEADVRLFSTNATQPVLISNNTASAEGGAIYAKPIEDNSEGARVCAQNFRMTGNAAPEGAAIYSDDDTGFRSELDAAQVYFNSDGDCGDSPTLASLGSVACAKGIACNEVSDNSAENSPGDPSGGSILYLYHYGQVGLDRFVMRGNTAGQLVSALSPIDGDNSLSNCLFVDNHTQHELVHEESALLRLDNCTFANNTIDNGFVFYADHGFTLTRSIVYQPSISTIDYQADGCTDCEVTQNVVSNDISTFPANATGVQLIGNPLFVDATNADTSQRDYHLRAVIQNGVVSASLAMDYATTGVSVDLDDDARNVDVPLVNHGGTGDLGAYEAKPIVDRVFADSLGDAVSLLLSP